MAKRGHSGEIDHPSPEEIDHARNNYFSYRQKHKFECFFNSQNFPMHYLDLSIRKSKDLNKPSTKGGFFRIFAMDLVNK